MSQVMQYEFRLFGPRKGSTVVINGHKFVNGKANLVQSSENMASCMRVLSFYAAYAKGTPEYDRALAAEEAGNGSGEADQESQPGKADSVRSSVQPNGTRPSAQNPEVINRNADSDSGGSGQNPSGDGHGHAGLPKFEEAKDRKEPIEPQTIGDADIAQAIAKLDPENDAHWVMTGQAKGKPKLNAVEESLGKAGVTRKDAESAIPGWDRDAARAAVVAGQN